MAYLQIVADNSSNLPLTRRDDPELGRTVSSLTAEEYETKCRAFVPANVRIFGGMFGRYGRVWDLPTSEVSFCFWMPGGAWCCCDFCTQDVIVCIITYQFANLYRNSMSSRAHVNQASPTEELSAMPYLKQCTTPNQKPIK
jgi:hypothetical protein